MDTETYKMFQEIEARLKKLEKGEKTKEKNKEDNDK